MCIFSLSFTDSSTRKQSPLMLSYFFHFSDCDVCDQTSLSTRRNFYFRKSIIGHSSRPLLSVTLRADIKQYTIVSINHKPFQVGSLTSLSKKRIIDGLPIVKLAGGSGGSEITFTILEVLFMIIFI